MMPKFSVKKPYTVVVAVVMLLVLGFVSFTKMTTDLLPTMSLPYVVVVTTYPGASPERVESEVTAVLESSLGTVNGVENVSSTSSENYSMIVLEFEEDMNMDSAMVKLSTAIDQLTFPDLVGTPMLLEMSPDMLATMMVSVSMEGKDIYELTQFVQEEVIPYLERQGGVASVDGSGLVEKSIEIRLVPELIGEINRKLQAKVTKKMDEAELELHDARQEIDKAKTELEKGKDTFATEQENTTQQLAEASKLLDQAMATQSAYSAQVSSLEASKAALEMERKAYEEYGILESYQQINDAFAQLLESTTPGTEGYEKMYQALYEPIYSAVYDGLYQTVFTPAVRLLFQAEIARLEYEEGADLSVEESLPETAESESGQEDESDQETTAPQESLEDGSGKKAMLQLLLEQLTDENADALLTEAVNQGLISADAAATVRNTSQGSVELLVPTVAKQTAEEQIAIMNAGLPRDVEDAIAHPEKLQNVITMMEQAGQGDMTKMLTIENLKQLYDVVNVRIPQIDSALANLNVEIQTAKVVLEEVNKGVQEAVENYTKVEAGKLTAAITMGAAQAQMTSGEAALEQALAKIEEGEEALKNARETALKSANLDALLNMETLSQLIFAQNFSMPAGYLQAGDTQFLLKVGDEFSSMEELKEMLLVDLKDLGMVRLKDVAYVTMIDNAGESYAKMNGEQAILLNIYKGSTAGTSDVSKKCKEAFEELETEFKGLQITPLMDQGDYIGMIVQSVLSNLIWGAGLAILVLILFLKDAKPTIVVAFSIPISVLFAVVLMYFTDITLNILSLSGLALGVGMLVDNSIVVIENIYRLRGLGMSAPRAAVKGANQVAGAIFASTLTTVCVFLPIVFTGGLARQLFTDMALTIGYSLGASLIVALTLVPSMGATLLKNNKEKTHKLFDKVMVLYRKSLEFCLKVKLVPLAISIVLLGYSIWQATQMGLILIPEMGGNQMSVNVSALEEMSDEEAYAMADRVMEAFGRIQGVETVGVMAGGGMAGLMGGGSDGPMSFTYSILLDEKTARDNSGVAAQMNEILAGETCEGSVSTSNMDLSALMGSGLQIKIYSNDLDTMLRVSEDMMSLLDSVDGFTEISNGQEDSDTEIRIVVDKDKAMALGLTVAQIYAQLSGDLATETTATSLTMEGQSYEVTIVDELKLLTLDNIMDQEFEVTVQNEDGESVKEIHKLSEFAEKQEAQALVSISRDNQARYMTVSASTEEGYNTTLLSRQVEELLDQYHAPAGCSVEIAGESTAVMDAMSDMFLMIALACVFIYLIMVAQFQSLLSPFIVIFTIPLAFTGGLLALVMAGEEISIVSMMGFLVLAGVVVNNGIVFVDYANQLRLEGMEKRASLVETGVTRMRPILMTAMTTILAMTTMAFSKDAAAVMGKGMALVSIGGLAYATFMTLYIVPVLYDMFFRREMKKVDLGDEDTLMDNDVE